MIRFLGATALRYVADLLEPEAPPDFGWAVAPEREPVHTDDFPCPACEADRERSLAYQAAYAVERAS